MFKSRRKLKIARDEKGQILVWILVVMIFGALVIAPLLAYASTSLMLTNRTGDNIDAYYAADAGVAWAMIELVQAREEGPEVNQGAGAYYTPSEPPPTVGAYTANVTILEASTARAPLDPYAYLDPYDTTHGASFPFGDPRLGLASGKYWLLQVYVSQKQTIRINWAFTTTPAGSACACLDVVSGKLVPPYAPSLCSSPMGSPATLPYQVTSPGWYTVVFYNVPDSATINSKPFVGGNNDFTWVRVQGYQDYLITSTAGDTTVTAYVRQTPGPSKYWVAQEISIFSWQIE